MTIVEIYIYVDITPYMWIHAMHICGIFPTCVELSSYKCYGTAMTPDDWNAKATNLLKAELKLAGVGYEELNKINRGAFPLTFFMQCMKALGKDLVRFDY
jgi:hypothetical protein